MTATLERTCSLTVPKSHLVSTASLVGLAVPKRPAVPALGGVRIDVANGVATLSANGTDCFARVTIPDTGTGEGTVVVDHAEIPKLLTALAKPLPRGKASAAPVTMTLEPEPTISIGEYTMPLQSYPTEHYPELPNTAPAVATVETAAFADVVARAATVASKDECLPVFCSVYLRIEKGRVVVACTDRYRLAIGAVATDYDRPDPIEMMVPAATVKTAVEYLNGPRVAIGHDPVGGAITLSSGDTLLGIRLAGGKYPEFERLVPVEDAIATTVTADRAELIAQANCARSVTKLKKTGAVVISTEGDAVRVIP